MQGWGWYAFLSELAGDDVTKIEKVGEMNFIACLNHKGYLDSKANYIKALEEKSKKKTKIR